MSHWQKRSVLGAVRFSFRERALAEAARYGSDSWVFLRELLQNARDAGASRVTFEVTREGDLERLVCRDDGCGMSAVHAHRYLFALYASSKEGDARQAGQFGVGFWSVLRFKPEKVVIRSRPQRGAAWQVELNHRLENAVFTSCEMAAGTEIVLERHRHRSRSSGRRRGSEQQSARLRRPLADKVFDAVNRYGRFLTRNVAARGFLDRRRSQPLLVSVNGRPVNVDMMLPAPSSAFRRRGFRGVVALGAEPRVELFANGLFVRQAACLEDLLDDKANDDPDDRSLDLPGSLAPQVLLDSSDLELLLARSDVRQTRHLAQLVRTAERELERLIEQQLEAVRPQSLFLVLWARIRAFGHRLAAARKLPLTWWLAPLALAGILLGWAMAGFTPHRGDGASWGVLDLPSSWRTGPADADVPFSRAFPGGYVGDLGESYPGPRVDPLSPGIGRVALTYRPVHETLFLTALVVDDPSAWSSIANRRAVPAGLYHGPRCSPASDSRAGEGCVTFRLLAAAGDLRLPVPTGHLLDPDSVRVNGEARRVFKTAKGEPLVLEGRQGDELVYRTSPASAPPSHRAPPPGPSPADLVAIGASLYRLPLERRLEEALEWVARTVEYDRSKTAVEAHFEGMAGGRSFAEAALEVGKGDCDVQNGVLVMLLREAGVTARLAVGYVGHLGQVAPGLHAWVEYLDDGERWQVADVSTRFTPAGTSPLRWVTGPGWAPGSAPHPPSSSVAAAEPGTSGSAGLEGLFTAAAVKQTARRLALPGSILAFLSVALGVVVLLRRSFMGGTVRLAHTDLAALLGGALQHPGLSRLPALMHGRFIPLIEPAGSVLRERWKRSTAISLHKAGQRSASGTLYSSAGATHLACDAAKRGLPVIDASRAEGRVTSLGLGAIDLDEWSDLLDRSTSSGLTRHLNAYLEAIGEDWRLALVSPLNQPLKVVDLARLGLGRRQVLIDPRSADFAPCGPRLDLRSDSSAFRLLDAVVEHLDLARPDRGRLLAELARRAVLEEHGR